MIGGPEGKGMGKSIENDCWKFAKLWKNMDIYVQEAQSIPNVFGEKKGPLWSL
jgi:hypothetical protein